jgi:hypothetical protein
MCSGISMTSFDLLESLETKLSCSALAVASVASVSGGSTPSDPSEPPVDTDPIPYPPTDESGPVGPGGHSMTV